jgi:hypothetical protein
MESSAKTKGFHSTPSIYSSFAVAPQRSLIWYNLTPILFTKGGESLKKGLYFTHKYRFLAIHAKGGESISPKQKDHQLQKFVEVFYFQIGILFLI